MGGKIAFDGDGGWASSAGLTGDQRTLMTYVRRLFTAPTEKADEFLANATNVRGTATFTVIDGVLSTMTVNVDAKLSKTGSDHGLEHTLTTAITDVGKTTADVPARGQGQSGGPGHHQPVTGGDRGQRGA